MPVFYPVHPSVYPNEFKTALEFESAYNVALKDRIAGLSDYKFVENGSTRRVKLQDGEYHRVTTDWLVEIKFRGCVIELREQNFSSDSDFYVVVWNPETEEIFTHEYATTRAACDSYAEVDITPEHRARAEEVNYWRFFEAYILIAQRQHRSPALAWGVRAKLTKKHSPRNLPVMEVGTQFEIVSGTDGRFGKSYLVRLDNGDKRYIPASKIESLPLPEEDYDFDAVTEKAHLSAVSRMRDISARAIAAKAGALFFVI